MTEDETTRKTEALILRQLAATKHRVVAQHSHLTETQVSRIASGQTGIRIHDLGLFLDSLGLKVVGKNDQLIDPKEYEAMRVLARKALED